MLKDSFGVYEVTFNYLEPTNNKHYEMRKYVNSKKIKALGGMYAIYCEEDQQLIFRKSEHLRDRSYGKFVDGKCNDSIDYSGFLSSKIEEDISKSYEECKGLLTKYCEFLENSYSLPSYIDKSKLTEEEFQTLKRLIRKSLP